MNEGAAVIRQELMANNELFRQLARRHSELEAQLHDFQHRRHLTADEEVQELRLKKLKLQVKDEMESLMRQRQFSPAGSA